MDAVRLVHREVLGGGESLHALRGEVFRRLVAVGGREDGAVLDAAGEGASGGRGLRSGRRRVVRVAMLLLGNGEEVEDVLLVGEQVLGVHLLQAEGGAGLRRREVVEPAVDLGPGALLADDTVAAAVGRHLAEETVEVDLLAAERGRAVGHVLIDQIELLELVDELRAVLLVVRTLLLRSLPAAAPTARLIT